MNSLFIEWISNNESKLLDMGIETENIRESPSGTIDSGVTVEQTSKRCLGQISVWCSGLMDIEILDIQSESRLLYKHLNVTEDSNFSLILEEYLMIMSSDR